MKALDRDVGANGRVRYSLQSEDSVGDVFAVHPHTGDITLLSPLDAEHKSSYVVHITARDSGRPSLSSFTTVRVDVGDVNDNPPYFLHKEYNLFAETTPLSPTRAKGKF